MSKSRFRTLPLRTAPNRVDRDERVIYGASAAQAVEALGHNLILDVKTIQQVVDLGNAKPNGVKSRFTHPGLSSDGMGKHLGRMKNFRVEGDKAVGDIYLSDAASQAPDGDLAGYVMELAEEDSEAFGMSMVAEGSRVWTFADGTETPVDEDEGRPAAALTLLPVLRVSALDAVDVVDEPAANRDGLFSSHLWGTNSLAEEMFGNFDEFLAEVDMTPEQAWDYALKYFDARHVDMKGMAMQEEQAAVEPQDEEIVAAVEIENEDETQSEEPVTPADNEELQALRQKAAKLEETVLAMQREARSKRFQELAANWQGETALKMDVLESLGEGTKPYISFCALMDALSAQIEQGALFEEMGSRTQTQNYGTAAAAMAAEARKIQAAEGLSYSQAYEQAVLRNPQLGAQHLNETRG